MNIQAAVGPVFSKQGLFVNPKQKCWGETEFGWDHKVNRTEMLMAIVETIIFWNKQPGAVCGNFCFLLHCYFFGSYYCSTEPFIKLRKKYPIFVGRCAKLKCRIL